MFDKMFQALEEKEEDGDGTGRSDFFNNTTNSMIGREITEMQRQVQDQQV
jgi:hypothetical protein